MFGARRMMKQTAVASQRHAVAKQHQGLAKETQARAEVTFAESTRLNEEAFRRVSTEAQDTLKLNTEVRFHALYTKR